MNQLEIVVAENLGKAYSEFTSEWSRFARWFGLPTKPHHETWVLRHASLRLNRGEAIGIIGQNGAGKSTLLKILTGTTRPTEGSLRVNGSIAALLELGIGFNPELTGRENARHVTGLMGIPEAEIAGLIPEIEKFAEIGEYFDQPVRTYSSGMQMRVAFSVATAKRPDLLIVDEALSVGDSYFVHKSFQRIREFREQGSSLLIVSHDPSAIQALCDRAVLLEKGSIILDGNPQEVTDYYNALIAEKENAGIRTIKVKRREVDTATDSGSNEAVFESIELFNDSGERVEFVDVNDPVELRVRVRINHLIPRLVFGYMIRDRLGQPVYGTNTSHTQQVIEDLVEGDFVEYRVQFKAAFGPGSYSVSISLSSTETHLVNNYQWKDLALVFTVANLSHPIFVGVSYAPPVLSVERMRASHSD